MRKSRQETILSIITSRDVETQEELLRLLSEAGFYATQATISRDIRKLNLTKVTGEKGKQKYVSLTDVNASVTDVSRRTIRDATISVSAAGNLLVIKTRTGMGMAVAVNIDELELPEILGTIAGDDVVFCAVTSPENAEEIKLRVNRLIGNI